MDRRPRPSGAVRPDARILPVQRRDRASFPWHRVFHPPTLRQFAGLLFSCAALGAVYFALEVLAAALPLVHHHPTDYSQYLVNAVWIFGWAIILRLSLFSVIPNSGRWTFYLPWILLTVPAIFIDTPFMEIVSASSLLSYGPWVIGLIIDIFIAWRRP
jgi:hypothetical protein